MKKMMFLLAVMLLVSSGVMASTIGFWRFEEGADGSGSTGTAPSTSGWILDSAAGSSTTATAIVSGGYPAYVSDNLNGGHLGMEFGAITSGFYISDSSALQWSEDTARTFEFFIRRDGDGPDGSTTEWILSKAYVANGGWGVYFNRTTGTINFNINSNVMTSTTDFSDGEIHHVAITHEASSGAYTLYVDYEQEDTLSYASGSVVSSPLYVGQGYGWQNQRVFNGMLDEFRISSAALTPSEFIQVPEPATMCIIAAGLAGALIRRKK